jgi:hypothetical protein
MLAEVPGPGLPADARFPPDRTAEALKTYRPAKDLGRLRDVLSRFCQSADASIRHAAFGAVVRLGVPAPLPLFQSLQEASEDRIPLTNALVTLGDPAGERLLWRFFALGDDNTRSKVLEALSLIGTPASLEMLEAAAAGKLPDTPKADGKITFSEPKPTDRSDPRPPLSGNLLRAAREIASTIQRRLEQGPVRAEAPPPPEKVEPQPEKPPETSETRIPKAREGTDPGVRPIRAGEPGSRPMIKPLEVMEEEERLAREAKPAPDLAARIAEAQARAAAMRNKNG